MTNSTPDTPPLRLGTRRSKLATVQAQWVADEITAATGRPVRLVPLSSAGDESSAPIATFGSTGVFVTALRDALLRGEVDFVVHSFKDLPTAPEPGLRLAAVPVREDPRDALVWRDGEIRPAAVPAGTRIGTGSPRRGAQLLALAPDVEVVPVRGNVDSRLAMVTSGALDGVVLATAGLARLGLLSPAVTPIPADTLVPAPAQGALAVECRAGDDAVAAVLARIDHAPTRTVVDAERTVLRELDAGCTAPVGAYAEWVSGGDARRLRLTGMVAAPDGSAVLRRSATGTGDAPADLGGRVAAALLAAGAATVLGAASPHGTPADPRTPPRVPQPH
ncbi:hydroxymethylbilane synthase [Amycolatopsis sp. NPDC021455]|uniref:hydroxymethylbilane synthase n=1 Tax=Amycolatopsis sp. NPDC021455 TaxID=3154901 RepID=UPI0033E5EF1B